MTKTYVQLVREIERLEAQADVARRKEAPDVIERIKDAIEVYGLTAEDLGFGSKDGSAKFADGSVSKEPKRKPGKQKARLAIKYRDDAGNTWTGRGSKPRWLAAALASGQRLEAFKVDERDSSAADTGHANGSSKSSRRASKAKRRNSAAKYKDESGHSWSGRGPKPGWLKAAIASGKALEEMAV